MLCLFGPPDGWPLRELLPKINVHRLHTLYIFKVTSIESCGCGILVPRMRVLDVWFIDIRISRHIWQHPAAARAHPRLLRHQHPFLLGSKNPNSLRQRLGGIFYVAFLFCQIVNVCCSFFERYEIVNSVGFSMSYFMTASHVSKLVESRSFNNESLNETSN